MGSLTWCQQWVLRFQSELALFPTVGFSHWVYCRGFNEANEEGDLHVSFHFLYSFCLLLRHIWDAARGEVL